MEILVVTKNRMLLKYMRGNLHNIHYFLPLVTCTGNQGEYTLTLQRPGEENMRPILFVRFECGCATR